MANVDSLAIGTPKEFEFIHWQAAIERLPTPALAYRLEIIYYRIL